MKQRLFGAAMALCVIMALILPKAFAADNASGAYAILYEDGELAFQNGSAPKSAKAVSKTYEVDLSAVYTGYPSNYAPWYNERKSVSVVTFADTVKPASTAYWFYGFENLQRIDNIGNLDTANVTNMAYMFYGCSGLTALHVSKFDTANVTYMPSMFYGCSGLTALDVSKFDTANVTDMSEMFELCASLAALDVSGFDTSNVTNMCAMFNKCSGLTALDVSGFDTANVTNMCAIFSECSTLTALDVSGFDTSKVTNMDTIFYGCSGLTALDVSKFDTANVTYMPYMFYGCSGLTALDVSGFDTSKVTNMDTIFYGCSGLTALDVSKFDTAKVTDMGFMFSGCSTLTALDVSSFHTANVTTMHCMFQGCSNLKTLDLSGFDTSKVTDMSWMFNQCSGLTALDLSNFDTSNVTTMALMFSGCSGLTALDVSDFDTSNVTNMGGMFYGCSGLMALDLSGFDTSNVTSMGGMFYGCSGLAALDVSGFDTANVTDMMGMFSGCSGLTALDVSGFDTSNVTDMWSMFSGCSGLAALDLFSFDTANVTDMEEMFSGCSNLKAICASDKFTTASVPETTYSNSRNMFKDCAALVGDAGTKYDSAHTDKEYARIDGGASAPGYFSPLTVSQPGVENSNVIGGVKITLSCDTPKAAIYYTTNGADPDASSFRYSVPFRLEETCVLKAVAILNGVRSSVKFSTIDVPKANASIPTPNPDGGPFPSGTLVSLDTYTDGAAIYYTTDGSAPTLNSPKYVSGIPLNRDTTIRAIAALSGYGISDVMEAAYRVSLTEDNKAIVRVGNAEAHEEEEITLPVSIDTTERTNIRAFSVVIRYGESLKYEGYNPLRDISRMDMTAGDEKMSHAVRIQLSDIGEFPGGNFFNLRFSVPAGVTDGKIPVTIDAERTTVTGAANTTSGRQDMALLCEDGYVNLRDTNNFRVSDGLNNPVTSVSQIAPGSTLTVDPGAPEGDFRTASVFCAVYDRDGKMVRLQVWEADVSDPMNISMSGKIQIPENVSVKEIRVFVLSENLVPLRASGILG